MLFTWNFILLLAFYAGLLALLPQVGVFLLLPILGGLFGLWLIDLGLTRLKQPQFTVERLFEQPASQSQPLTVTLALTNPLRRPIKLTFKDEPPFEVLVTNSAPQGELTLLPGETKRIDYSITAPLRGKFYFGMLNLRYSGPLALYKHTTRLEPGNAILEVYPDLSQLNQLRFLLQNDSQQSGIHRERIFKMAGEFAQIREYAPGDDFRKINWKVAAHIGKPVVNQYEPEKDQSIYLLLDSGRLLFDQANCAQRTRMDYFLDSALLLAYNILTYGDQVGALGFNSRVERYLPAGKGRYQMELLMRQFYDLQAVMVESDYREAFCFWQSKVNKRCLLFVYTDISDSESSRELLDHLKGLSRRHRVVCILLKKDYLTAVMNQPLHNETTAYLKATAWELHWERETAKRLLQLNGINVLEVSADNIRRTVVEHYQYLKQSGLF